MAIQYVLSTADNDGISNEHWTEVYPLPVDGFAGNLLAWAHDLRVLHSQLSKFLSLSKCPSAHNNIKTDTTTSN